MKEKKIGSNGKISIFYENIGKNNQVFNGYPCKHVTSYTIMYVDTNLLEKFIC